MLYPSLLLPISWDWPCPGQAELTLWQASPLCDSGQGYTHSPDGNSRSHRDIHQGILEPQALVLNLLRVCLLGYLLLGSVSFSVPPNTLYISTWDRELTCYKHLFLDPAPQSRALRNGAVEWASSFSVHLAHGGLRRTDSKQRSTQTKHAALEPACNAFVIWSLIHWSHSARLSGKWLQITAILRLPSFPPSSNPHTCVCVCVYYSGYSGIQLYSIKRLLFINFPFFTYFPAELIMGSIGISYWVV